VSLSRQVLAHPATRKVTATALAKVHACAPVSSWTSPVCRQGRGQHEGCCVGHVVDGDERLWDRTDGQRRLTGDGRRVEVVRVEALKKFDARQHGSLQPRTACGVLGGAHVAPERRITPDVGAAPGKHDEPSHPGPD
jgi:hypothetical protein